MQSQPQLALTQGKAHKERKTYCQHGCLDNARVSEWKAERERKRQRERGGKSELPFRDRHRETLQAISLNDTERVARQSLQPLPHPFSPRLPLPPTPFAAPLFQPLLPRVDASFVLPSQPWGKNASRCSQLMRRMVLLSEAHNWHRARVTGAAGWAQRPGARARTFSRGFAVNLLHKSALNRPSKQFSSS